MSYFKSGSISNPRHRHFRTPTAELSRSVSLPADQTQEGVAHHQAPTQARSVFLQGSGSPQQELPHRKPSRKDSGKIFGQGQPAVMFPSTGARQGLGVGQGKVVGRTSYGGRGQGEGLGERLLGASGKSLSLSEMTQVAEKGVVHQQKSLSSMGKSLSLDRHGCYGIAAPGNELVRVVPSRSEEKKVTSLTDLSSHPKPEPEWYKVDLDSDLSLCSLGSQHEATPMVTPTFVKEKPFCKLPTFTKRAKGDKVEGKLSCASMKRPQVHPIEAPVHSIKPSVHAMQTSVCSNEPTAHSIGASGASPISAGAGRGRIGGASIQQNFTYIGQSPIPAHCSITPPVCRVKPPPIHVEAPDYTIQTPFHSAEASFSSNWNYPACSPTQNIALGSGEVPLLSPDDPSESSVRIRVFSNHPICSIESPVEPLPRPPLRSPSPAPGHQQLCTLSPSLSASRAGTENSDANLSSYPPSHYEHKATPTVPSHLGLAASGRRKSEMLPESAKPNVVIQRRRSSLFHPPSFHSHPPRATPRPASPSSPILPYHLSFSSSPETPPPRGGAMNFLVPPQKAPQEAPQRAPQEAPQEAPQRAPQEVPQRAPQEASQRAPQEVPQRAPQEASQRAPQEVPQRAPQEAPQRAPQEVPQRAPQEAPQRAPQEAPQRAPQEAPQEAPIQAASTSGHVQEGPRKRSASLNLQEPSLRRGSGMGMPLSPPSGGELKVCEGVARARAASLITPYAVSVINTPCLEPRSAGRVTPGTGQFKGGLHRSSGRYDLLEPSTLSPIFDHQPQDPFQSQELGSDYTDGSNRSLHENVKNPTGPQIFRFPPEYQEGDTKGGQLPPCHLMPQISSLFPPRKSLSGSSQSLSLGPQRSKTQGGGDRAPMEGRAEVKRAGSFDYLQDQPRKVSATDRDNTLFFLLQYPGLSQDGRLSRSNSNAGARPEPNLQDVVQFLRSSDKTLVANAASYLQHLAYGDDTMKTKIREHEAIPVLTSLIRHQDSKVLANVLGALKNLSFGRSTVENKHAIASDHALMDIMMALKNSQVPEIRELLTGLLWNLSSCEDLKLKLMKACLHDLVEMVLVPCTGWTTEMASVPTARPQGLRWSPELKNATGILRNISSAGEPARSFMRNTNGMVDTLMWLLRAGVQQGSNVADEKTVENTVCILRNLSYRLEGEVDPQEGGEDVLDREWEQEQRRELEDLDRSLTNSSPGCLPFCIRPQTRREAPPRVTLTSVNRMNSKNVDFAFPDASVLPKRRKPVYGKSLLWQPEVAFVYLSVTEQFSDCVDAVEAATGAIQNLTACNWKWSVYISNIIRTSNGLRVLSELLNNGHDTVVRAAATTLRNLARDQRNRALLGPQSVPNIIPRLPLSTNHLGISEDTSVALLCCLMELFTESPENAKLFRDEGGILILTRLTRSREYTPKVTYAAQKACSLLWDYKDCKPALKKVGWDISQYSRVTKDVDSRFELDVLGSMSRDHQQGTRRSSSKSSRGGKHGGSAGSKKAGKKRREVVELEEGPSSSTAQPSNESYLASQNLSGPLPAVTVHETGLTSQTSPTSTVTPAQPVSQQQSPPANQQPVLQQFPEEPNYQTIPTPSSHAPSSSGVLSQQKPPSPALIEPSYQSVPPPTSPSSVPSSHTPPNVSHAPKQGPTIIYQSIEDAEATHKPSTPEVATSPLQGAPPSTSSGGRIETTPSVTTSGPLSVTSLEEEAEHDPNATYASVDIEKKRASRRIREQKKKKEQQHPKPEMVESVDSWV